MSVLRVESGEVAPILIAELGGLDVVEVEDVAVKTVDSSLVLALLRKNFLSTSDQGCFSYSNSAGLDEYQETG